jgi:chorismate-pyruvate lyase
VPRAALPNPPPSNAPCDTQRQPARKRRVNQSPRATPELDALVGLFYESRDELGQFRELPADQIPQPARALLDHDEHMTVTVEAHHGCPVNVRVLQRLRTDTHYARKILLARARDGAIVQFGIMRINVTVLAPDVRAEIEGEQIPLGRVLINHDVLRNVRLLSLWQVQPGADLRSLFALEAPRVVYGRTALIYCNGVPAVELLEIVAPAEA